MKPIAVFYATREGQTRRIAEFVAASVQTRGFEVDVRNLAQKTDVVLTNYTAMILAASVHAGQHEREMIDFVKNHRFELDAIPTAFISATLSEAGAERVSATDEERTRFETDVRQMIDRFCEETVWRPKRVFPVAGSLLYSKYNFLIRFIMKRISKKAGGDTDTSRDYEYTNWAALKQFVDDFCDALVYDGSESTITAVP